MGNMTLAIPDILLERMKRFKEIKWSEIARQALEKRVNEFEEIEEIASKSRLTENDAKEIALKINTSVAKRLGLIK